MRAIGSEVGFIKTYFEVFSFKQLPATRRTVLALGARLGLANGFPRFATGEADDGTPIVARVDDIPVSKRFFAGGDTTVRGFSLDRLGDETTISPEGFPDRRQRRRGPQQRDAGRRGRAAAGASGSWTPATSWPGHRRCA